MRQGGWTESRKYTLLLRHHLQLYSRRRERSHRRRFPSTCRRKGPQIRGNEIGFGIVGEAFTVEHVFEVLENESAVEDATFKMSRQREYPR